MTTAVALHRRARRRKARLAAACAAILASIGSTASAQTSADVDIDDDDIGGVVMSRNGPEAGVWVIAETSDFGTRFIGVAIGNTVSGEARPLARIPAQPAARRFERIAALVREWAPDALVVGLPLGPDGEEQPATEGARRFARQLEGRFGRPVALVDERYSSLAAQVDGAPSHADDADAAAIILRQYLDEQ